MIKRSVFIIMVMILFSTLTLSGQKVQYKVGDTSGANNEINAYFRIVNSSASAIPMSELVLRYYYVKEGTANETVEVFWATFGAANFVPTLHSGYVEYAFGAGAGSLSAGATAEVQTRIHKSDWSNYDESNDASYDGTKTAFADWDKVALFRSGTLVWGIEPGAGVTPNPTNVPTPEITPVPTVAQTPDPGTPAPTVAPTPDPGTPSPTDAPTPDPTATPAGGSYVPPPAADDWLHVEGNTIRDLNGKVVRLTGANWFGFNNNQRIFDGLYSCNMRDSLQMMANKGINILRVPMSGNVTKTWRLGTPAMPAQDPSWLNPDLAGLNSLQVFDKVVQYCKEVGMKIMVDFHSAAMDDHVFPVWWKDSYTPADWIEDWKFIASRYKNDDTIVIFDLENEPHGKPWMETTYAKWDNSSDTNNWKKAVEDVSAAIFAIHPNVLVMVEGIEGFPKDGVTWTSSVEANYYGNWWGGNLRGVAQYPINLGTHQNRLVYSPHDYGPLVYEQPWFYAGFTYDTLMTDCWLPNWYYLVGDYPLLIGEWGGKLDGGPNEKWLNAMKTLIVNSNLHHTFWCFNPNSGDTGGLVTGDWKTLDAAKYAILEPTLWQNSAGKYIGLDHSVSLGGAMTLSDILALHPELTGKIVESSAGTGINVSAYYLAGGVAPIPPSGGATPGPTAEATPAPTDGPTAESTAGPTADPTPDPVTPAPTDVIPDPTPDPTPVPTPDPTTPPSTGCELIVTGTGTGSLNTAGAFCFKTQYAISGWGISNFDGRTISVTVNGTGSAVTTAGAPLPPKAASDYYCFEISAGSLAWAAVYWW